MPESETYPCDGTFADLAPADQLSVAQLVKDGGAIIGTVEQIIARLKRTRKLALLRETVTDRIVGAAALKTPEPDYRADKFAEAGVPITRFEDASELGYVVIAKDKRGLQLSGGLVDEIVNDITESVFATTDNHTMRNNLTRSGFMRAGDEWPGQKGALSLWLLTTGLVGESHAEVALSVTPTDPSQLNYEASDK
jgi:hypothetical protein